MDVISLRYAESLFELGKEENSIDLYKEDMDKVLEVFQSDSKIVQFFSHVTIGNDVKIDLLDQSFENQISHYVLNFLKVLVVKRRMGHIIDICKQFHLLCNEYLGIKEGILYSAFALDDEEISSIEEAIGKKEEAEVQLKQVIDTSLIGGVKVEIDHHVYDNSVSMKLGSLKSELLGK